jgi:elongation factor G
LKDFKTSDIRNLVLISHHGMGKTSLAEAMLFQAKATNRLGRIAEGNTLLDYGPDEVQRKLTVSLGLAQLEWAGRKVNLLDTPGYADFMGDLCSGLRVADGALLLLRASGTLDVGVELFWEMLKARKMSTAIVVNMMDKEHADFRAAVRAAHDKLGAAAVPVQLPIGAAESFRGLVDLIERKAYVYSGAGMDAKAQAQDVPADMAAAVEQARAALMEEAATGDEELMEKFLDKGGLGPEEICKGLAERIEAGELVPAFCCSAHNNVGVKELLDAAVALMPPPTGRPARGTLPGDGQVVDLAHRPDAPVALVVFKTVSEQHVGDLSLFRVYEGTIEPGKEVLNTTRNRPEKMGTLYHLVGKERQDARAIVAGDIGAAVKLRETHTGDTLADRSRPVVLPGVDLPASVLTESLHAKNKGDEEKIANGLWRLHEEDPTFRVVHEQSTRQTLVKGLGELQLEVMVAKLKRRYGVEVQLTRPRVPYRESIAKKIEHQYRHKKQTGGRGQFGEVHLRVEPLRNGAGFEFVDEIKGGVVPNQYIPAVEKGIVEAMQEGVLAGYPVVDVRTALFYGKHHDVDSSEMAFKIAAAMCFKEAVAMAGAYLLEPIDEVQVRVPEEYMGDVMGDLSSKRGKILGMETQGHYQVIRALVPQAELYKYSTHLRSITQGRGVFSAKFLHYEKVPPELSERVIAAAKAEKEAEARA